MNASAVGPEILLTAKDIAKEFGVSTAWVSAHSNGSRRPQLSSVKLGKVVRFRREDVDAFIQQCRRLAC